MRIILKNTVQLASILVLAGGLGLAPALAQEAAANADSETAAGAAVDAFTPDTVDPANPFGEIDVTAAGATEEEVKVFFEGLPAEQQAELEGRCGVILHPVHQERYAEESASALCRNLLGAGLIEAPADEAAPDTEPAGGDAAAPDEEPAAEAEPAPAQ